MMPDSIHAQSDVNINDSCNNCFCCQRRSKEKTGGSKLTRKKVAKKSTVIDLTKPLEVHPMKRHTVTHIDATITQDDEVGEPPAVKNPL